MLFMVIRFARGNFDIRIHKSLVCQQSRFQLQQSFSCGFKIGLISSQRVCGDSMIGSIHFNSLPDLSAMNLCLNHLVGGIIANVLE